MGKLSWLKSIGEAMLGEFKVALIDRLSRVETKIDNIEEDIEEIKGDVKNLGSKTIRLETATIEIQALLKRAGAPICQHLELTPGSPLKLTPFGEDIAKDISAYDFVKNNREILFSLLDAQKPTTPYDVQIY